jgi:endo-1,4-beta-xylanase
MTKAPRRHVATTATHLAIVWLVTACGDTTSRGDDDAGKGGQNGGSGASGSGVGGSVGNAAGKDGSGGTAGGNAGSSGSSGGATSGAGEASSGAGGTSGALGGAGGMLGGTGGAPGGTGGASAGGGGTTACDLPATFQWTSTGPIIAPRSDASHDLVAVKDPSIVRFNDRWHVYASSVSNSGVYGMVYTSFTDWSALSSATWYHMDQTAGFDTYVAAPQVFFFRPQNKWYLIFQSGPPMYSTADDVGAPTTWTRPAPFFASEPPIITQNGGWLDYWIICDSAFCHLFFSDDHGRWYKSKTAIGSFPNGFDTPIIVMQDPDAGRLFEGSNVYKVGTNRYLALIEAFDSTSNWKRYFRSFTAESLEGPWTPYRDSGTAPFAGPSNVMFEGTPWTANISHGEAIRAGYDETLVLDTCNLGFLYQGFDPASDGIDYNKLPWRLGLLRPQ